MSNAQCFCYPNKPNGQCEHCNRAALWVDRDVYCLANEVGERALTEALEDIENLYSFICPECGADVSEIEIDEYQCNSCKSIFPNNEADSKPQDIMQWFVVSSWLFGKLRAQEEPVVEFMGLQLWGRTCCGQGIALDGTFQEISRSL